MNTGVRGEKLEEQPEEREGTEAGTEVEEEVERERCQDCVLNLEDAGRIGKSQHGVGNSMRKVRREKKASQFQS